RKHALNHAIKLAHSHHTLLRRMTASNIAKLFKAFPDLEEDAINAVYDLCEGQDLNVRRAGNITHLRMSEEQPRWLERNVDVLVQLLQSDEPEEVAVVKMALIQHLELDFKVTLGILCDQIVPPDDPMEDEDKTIRERLRALVVAFLAQDARKPLLAQLQGQGRGAAEQEDMLIDTLIKALGTITPSLLLRIDALAGSIQTLRGGRGQDILLFLPSFNDGRPTRHGNELVHLLLARAASTLREDLEPGRNPASLEPPIPRQERLLRVRLSAPFIIPHAAQLSQLLRSVAVDWLRPRHNTQRCAWGFSFLEQEMRPYGFDGDVYRI
ncbi:apoptosis inhibitory protein 5-domain-containing protein, partial [Lactarius sanguifluus]